MQGPELGAAVVAEAREWLGTPFRWQASVRGVGCDCKGLVWGVARALGRSEADNGYARAADYRQVDPARLRKGLAAVFDPVPFDGLEAIAAGDVLLMRVAGREQHIGIATGERSVIHCFARGPRQVIEQALAVVVPVWPIASIWRWRA